MAWLMTILLFAQTPPIDIEKNAEPPGRLSATDLPGYLEALQDERVNAHKTLDAAAPSPTFIELWTHPDRYRNQIIRVQGRASRRFRQEAIGDFPALTELWLIDQARNPFCVVYPDVGSKDALEVGDTVAFTGRFLRLLSYPSSDAERFAPLIVGPRPPVSAEEQGGTSSAFASIRTMDWVLAAILAAGAAFAFLSMHLRRPQNQQIRKSALAGLTEPEPSFIDQPKPEEPEAAAL